MFEQSQRRSIASWAVDKVNFLKPSPSTTGVSSDNHLLHTSCPRTILAILGEKNVQIGVWFGGAWEFNAQDKHVLPLTGVMAPNANSHKKTTTQGSTHTRTRTTTTTTITTTTTGTITINGKSDNIMNNDNNQLQRQEQNTDNKK